MSWNLNNYEEEYELFNSMTEENIDMFGLSVSFVKSTGQNLDLIFGEYTHKKLMQDGVIKVNVLPENSEDFESLGNMFGKFGFVNNETFNCYISASNADKMGYDDFRIRAVGDIIVLPNGKKFEITFVDYEVLGANNMFPYTNKKNVYLIKSKLWSYNADTKEEAPKDNEDFLEEFNFTKLDQVFNKPDGGPIKVPFEMNPKMNVEEFMSAFNGEMTPEVDENVPEEEPLADPVIVEFGSHPTVNVDDFMVGFNSEITKEIDITPTPIPDTTPSTPPATEKTPSRVTQNKEATGIEIETRDIFGEWG